MSAVIRKISIGSDYKNDAMHYAVGQQVYGGHEISHILFEDEDEKYLQESFQPLFSQVAEM